MDGGQMGHDSGRGDGAPAAGEPGVSRRELVGGAASVGGGLSLAASLASCDLGGDDDSNSKEPSTARGPQGKPKSGGHFRLAVAGGGNAETLNPGASQSAADFSRVKDLYFANQKILYDEGGYIIPAFGNYLSVTSDKVINATTGVVSPF